MKDRKVKSGKEILDDFFMEISNIENVDKDISTILYELYKENKLTEKAVINKLEELRKNGSQN